MTDSTRLLSTALALVEYVKWFQLLYSIDHVCAQSDREAAQLFELWLKSDSNITPILCASFDEFALCFS